MAVVGAVVAVLEPVEEYRATMVAGLEHAGFTVRCVTSVEELLRAKAPYALCCVDDQALDGLEAFTTACPDTMVVVARNPRSRVPTRWFLSAGAASVLSRDASAAAFGAALRAVASGLVVVPMSEAGALIGAVNPGLLRTLSEQERSWLVDLAEGRTIASIAQRSRLSEREMYRRLDRLYGRLGVNGRAGAVAFAGEWGLLGLSDRTAPARPVPNAAVALSAAGTPGAHRAVG